MKLKSFTKFVWILKQLSHHFDKWGCSCVCCWHGSFNNHTACALAPFLQLEDLRFSCSSESVAVSFQQRNLWSPKAEPGPRSSQVPHVSIGWSVENKMLRRCLPITSLYQIKGLKVHFPFSCWRKLHRFLRAEISSWPGGESEGLRQFQEGLQLPL